MKKNEDIHVIHTKIRLFYLLCCCCATVNSCCQADRPRRWREGTLRVNMVPSTCGVNLSLCAAAEFRPFSSLFRFIFAAPGSTLSAWVDCNKYPPPDHSTDKQEHNQNKQSNHGDLHESRPPLSLRCPRRNRRWRRQDPHLSNFRSRTLRATNVVSCATHDCSHEFGFLFLGCCCYSSPAPSRRWRFC